MLKIKSVFCNRIQRSDGGEGYYWGGNFYSIGQMIEESRSPRVVSITEHQPAGNGDRYYCDIHTDDGGMIRDFNVSTIKYVEE